MGYDDTRADQLWYWQRDAVVGGNKVQALPYKGKGIWVLGSKAGEYCSIEDDWAVVGGLVLLLEPGVVRGDSVYRVLLIYCIGADEAVELARSNWPPPAEEDGQVRAEPEEYIGWEVELCEFLKSAVGVQCHTRGL